ncbi:MAG: nucleotidyltransferase family protein [Candidatus Pacebacteria bacterium]|nr:nucleotidyltransferase family protein [Candidatus Paceibacterota bacterium]MBP9851458.1 nucleotidyltransferase family protein [Candidatus Paceibacterota bacterium]
MKLVILAAGKSTRFLPLTEHTPKPLIFIEGKPLAEYTLDLCVDHVEEIIFVINESLGYKVQEYFGNSYKNVPISYATQKSDSPKGTLSAVLCALPLLDQEMFAVCNCDDLYKKEDVDKAFLSNEYGMGLTTSKMPFQYYGVDVKDGFIQGFRRHEKSEELVEDKFVNGFYILSPDIFSFTPVGLIDGELGLPQTLFANLEKLPLKEFTFTEWVAVNSPENIPNAVDFIKRNYTNSLDS